MSAPEPTRIPLPLSPTGPGAGSGYVAAPQLDGQGIDRLDPGVCATVSRIDAADADMDRLKAMGVCVGRRIEVIKRGDPMILRVLGSRLGLSHRLANRIMVSACIAPDCSHHP
ncbi:MAG: FeoA family protein [Planctomycetota bacterium]|nr:FeoA family protein [Planctomycetota bacterium]